MALPQRALRGDVVTFTQDFSRHSMQEPLAQSIDLHEDRLEMRPEQGFLREVPSNPLVYRIRTDLSWEDVLNSSASTRLFLSGMFPLVLKFREFF